MNVGVVGAGMIGATCARVLGGLGHRVALSNSRGPRTLADAVAAMPGDVRATTVADAAAFGDVVLVAIPFGRLRDLPADALAGTVVVDAMNYYPRRDGQIAELDDATTTSSELVAAHLPGARVVKAFNTIYFRRLAEERRAPGDPRRLAIPVASDDADAKRVVSGLIDEMGFDPVDNGPLGEGGRRQQPGTPVYNEPLTADDLRAALAS